VVHDFFHQQQVKLRSTYNWNQPTPTWYRASGGISAQNWDDLYRLGIYLPILDPQDETSKYSMAMVNLRTCTLKSSPNVGTLPETNSSHWKHWGWKIHFFFDGMANFQAS